jgi:GNAT superfamily N-acetyltransferase
MPTAAAQRLERMGLTLVSDPRPTSTDVDVLRTGLYEDLDAKGVPAENRRHLAYYLRDATGAVVGGAEGDVRWDWLKLDKMWVAPALRRQGLGAVLLTAFEEAGVRMGCRHARTSTYSCQAPGFYQRLGYAVLAEYQDYPPGYTKLDLVKHFAPEREP